MLVVQNLKFCHFVDRRSSFSPQDFIANIFNKQAALIGQPQQSYARVSDWSISIHNLLYIFPSFEFSIYVLTFYTVCWPGIKTFIIFALTFDGI